MMSSRLAGGGCGFAADLGQGERDPSSTGTLAATCAATPLTDRPCESWQKPVSSANPNPNLTVTRELPAAHR